MTEPKIQFLAFDGCPLADRARKSLEKALSEAGLGPYEEVDILAPETPEEIRGWGSPTILIDGEDVTGNPKGDSVGCRIYSGPDRVPTVAIISQHLRQVRAR